MAKLLKVTLVRSGINRQAKHKQTVARLGLRRMHASAVVPDNEAVRGMIRSVSHMVRVEPADE
jgi:large subunit ribosomal protein L30